MAAAAGPGAPTNLRCEYQVNPLALDTDRPRLSWEVTDGRRGAVQSAYQVLAATTVEKLQEGRADLWDSGRVSSDQSNQIQYAGAPLHSGMRVYWKVRTWDSHGSPSPFSQAAWWETGLLRPEDWRATWICSNEPLPDRDELFYQDNPAPLFRKEVQIRKPVRWARAYVSGLGYYELHINGRRVGDHVLDPGWTTYSKRVLYSAYDVTSMLKQGANAIGAMLGNGWYNPLPIRLFGRWNLRKILDVGKPRLILQLEVAYADGSRETFVTDETWRVGLGPVLRNSIYLGEVYDARREVPGWDAPGFDDSGWPHAVGATEPVGPLVAQMAPPIRVCRVLKPVKLTEPKPGVFIFDLGQNFAGWVRLRVRGEAGTSVTMRYGELLYPDGTLNCMTSACTQIKDGHIDGGPGAPRDALQTDTYILKGGGPEEYCPRFTWHGFRYVEVTGYPGRPTLEAVEGLQLHSAVEEAGSFRCSNELLNRIQSLCMWAQLSNMFSVQSDCPHRERLGYGGDIVAASEMALMNLDMAAFYTKAVRDLQDAARPNGGMTETSPFVGIADRGLGGDSGPIGWGTAYPLLQWQLYQYHGDKRLMEEQYPTTKRWMEFLQSKAKDNCIDVCISDHESVVQKPEALTATAFYYYNAWMASRIARTLGRNADADQYERLAEQIRGAFNKRFLVAGTGRYDTATQACQAFALYMGLTPDQERDAALGVLVKDILELHSGHLTTGIFGTKYMLNALTDMGRADVAYTIATQRTYPSYGYMLEHGATTLWESWRLDEYTYSHNHPMFGSISEWFYKALGGINPDPERPGFQRMLIRPQPVGDLEWARTEHRTMYGLVRTAWRKAAGGLRFDVSLPANTSALVMVPLLGIGKPSVTEGGRVLLRNGVPTANADAPRFVGLRDGFAAFEVGAGTYSFGVR